MKTIRRAIVAPQCYGARDVRPSGPSPGRRGRRCDGRLSSGASADDASSDDVAPTSEFGEVPQPAGVEAGAAKAPPQLAETHNAGAEATRSGICAASISTVLVLAQDLELQTRRFRTRIGCFPGNELRFYPTDETCRRTLRWVDRSRAWMAKTSRDSGCWTRVSRQDGRQRSR